MSSPSYIGTYAFYQTIAPVAQLTIFVACRVSSTRRYLASSRVSEIPQGWRPKQSVKRAQLRHVVRGGATAGFCPMRPAYRTRSSPECLNPAWSWTRPFPIQSFWRHFTSRWVETTCVIRSHRALGARKATALLKHLSCLQTRRVSRVGPAPGPPRGRASHDSPTHPATGSQSAQHRASGRTGHRSGHGRVSCYGMLPGIPGP